MFMDNPMSETQVDALIKVVTQKLNGNIFSLHLKKTVTETPQRVFCVYEVYDKNDGSDYIATYVTTIGNQVIQINKNIVQEVDKNINCGVVLRPDIRFESMNMIDVDIPVETYIQIVENILGIEKIQKIAQRTKKYHKQWIAERFMRLY